MAIPIEMTMLYTIISVILFLLVGLLLFYDKPTFNTTVFAFMLSFINILFSIIATFSYFGIDIYGFTSEGELVSNPTVEIASFGLVFLLFVYISVMLTFYCLYLFYEKPWVYAMESYGKKKPMWYEQQN